MRFALYRGQSLHAVIEADPGKSPPEAVAEGLRAANGATACVPLVDAAHESALVAKAAQVETSHTKVHGKGVGAMSLPDLRALVFVLAAKAGIEVEP